MTRASFRYTINHRDLLGLFRSSHRRYPVEKMLLKISQIYRKTPVLESLFTNVAGLRPATLLKKILQHWCVPMKFVKFLGAHILKNICERLLLFVSLRNTIANSGGEFGLDEASLECKVRIFLNVTILFNQIQPYNLYVC